MKKLLTIIALAFVSVMLVACSNNATTTTKKQATTTAKPAAQTTTTESAGTKATTTKQASETDNLVDEKYNGIAKGKKVYLTTCGQSDIDTVRNIIENADEEETYVNQYAVGGEEDKEYQVNICYGNLISASDVEEGSVVYLVLGTSSKGLGSAGVDVASETARAKAFGDLAKEGKITLIILHVGGTARRGASTDPVLDAVCANANAILVLETGNADGYFTNISGVDVYRYTKLANMVPSFVAMFGIEE